MAIPFIKKFSNPAPQDFSLFDDPKPEPIKVPTKTITQYGNNKLERNVNFSDSKNSVLVDDISLTLKGRLLLVSIFLFKIFTTNLYLPV